MLQNIKYKENIKRLVQSLPSLECLRGQRVLIAGAAGMLGVVLVDCLMYANRIWDLHVKVLALSRCRKRAEDHFSQYYDDKDFEYIEGDVNQKIPEVGVCDYIIHAASNTHPVAYSTDPIGTMTSNIIGTYHLLEYAVKHSIKRFVFLSSVEIYGENRGDTEKFTEEYCGYLDCNTLRAGYPESKRAGESLCCAYEKQYGIPVVIPRLCRLYGPTMNWSDSKAISQFIKNAVLEEDIVLKSDGKQYYSYLYVMDAVSAILTIILKGKPGEAYNVSSAESDIYMKDLAAMLAVQGNSRVVFEIPDIIEKSGFSKATKAVLDNSKLKSLGWSELYKLNEGLAVTIEILRERYQI